MKKSGILACGGTRSKARLEAYIFFGLFEFAVCIGFEVDLEHPAKPFIETFK